MNQKRLRNTDIDKQNDVRSNLCQKSVFDFSNLEFESLEQLFDKIRVLSKYSHVQQTPKPLAQVPAAVPPLFVHSELRKII